MARFVCTAERRGLTIPGLFGVFYYRSANPRTLDALKGFLPVPVEGLTREFAAGATPEDVCARTIRTLHGRRRAALLHQQPAHRRAQQVLANILDKAGVKA